jgi:hypothetical protein
MPLTFLPTVDKSVHNPDNLWETSPPSPGMVVPQKRHDCHWGSSARQCASSDLVISPVIHNPQDLLLPLSFSNSFLYREKTLSKGQL